MKTGDIYWDATWKKLCIHIRGDEEAFHSDVFDSTNLHASIERCGESCGLVFNCATDTMEVTDFNILEFLNDPSVIKLLRKKANE